MKGFKDLKFQEHPMGGGLQAIMFFDNGYGVSVVRFKMQTGLYGSYTSNESEWELAVLYGTKDEWSITYETPITNNVMGHLSEEEVSNVMKKIQKLKT